jgi:hypothetical protein
MHEEVIRQRDIELEGKNERILELIAETDDLRTRLCKAETAAAAATRRAHDAMAVAAAAVVVAVVLLLLLLAWAGWPWIAAFPSDHWPPYADNGTGTAGPSVVGQLSPAAL